LIELRLACDDLRICIGGALQAYCQIILDSVSSSAIKTDMEYYTGEVQQAILRTEERVHLYFVAGW
jgi:hypothetical protein